MSVLPKSRLLRWIAIAVLAVGLYALLGFQVAPRVVRSQAVSFVKEKYGRDLAIGEVLINPFLLQVEIRDFVLPDADGSPMIGFKRLFVDFEVSSLWNRAWVFRDVTIEAPELRAVVRPDQKLNLLDLAPEPSPEPSGPPPRLWLKSFVVEAGTIGFTDLARPQPFRRQFSPVAFALKDFRTTAEGGGFDLSASTPNAELFQIKGSVEVTPAVASRGRFTFKGLHLPGVAEYLGDALPFGLTSGTAELGGEYDVVVGEELAARLKIPNIAVADLALRARGADADWVRIPSIEVADTALALVKRTASVGSVKVQGLDVQAWMNADGSINLLQMTSPSGAAPAATAASTQTDGATASPAPGSATAPAQAPAAPWTATVGTFSLAGAHIDFEDRRATPARRFVVAPLDLTVQGASLDLAKPVDLKVSGIVNDVAPFHADGQVTPSPLAADLAIGLDGARMEILQPYVLPVADLTITDGRLTVDGRVKLDPPEAPGPDLSFAGNVAIDGFASQDNTLHQDFVNFASLRVEGIRYAMGPDSATVERVLVGKPFARVVISPERVINISAVLDPKGTAAALEARRAAARAEAAMTPAVRKRREAEREEAEERAAEARERQEGAGEAKVEPAPLPQEGMPVRIGEVRITDGTLDFADNNVQPNFAAKIFALDGSIKGLSSDPTSHAQVDLKGKVDEFSPVTIAGEVQPFSFERYTDIGLKFENISLPIFNPYSGRFAGYAIAKGKLTTDLHYRIDNRALDAQHHIRIDQLEWGEETAGQGEATLPVKFATFLLRDRNGVIDLDIPVQGTLDDPTFKVGPIIWKVIKNLIVKAVTAPFALLGALFSGAEEAQHVDFTPGMADLDATSASQLDALGKSLVEKPGLTLEVPVMSLAALDGPALEEQAWQAALAAAAAESLPPARKEGAVRPPYADLSPRNKLEVLAALIESQTGAEPKAPEPPQAPEGASGEERDALADQATIEAWEREARARVTVPADAAEKLAEARASAVQRALLDGTGLEPARVFLVKNGTVTDADGKVQLKLELK